MQYWSFDVIYSSNDSFTFAQEPYDVQCDTRIADADSHITINKVRRARWKRLIDIGSKLLRLNILQSPLLCGHWNSINVSTRPKLPAVLDRPALHNFRTFIDTPKIVTSSWSYELGRVKRTKGHDAYYVDRRRYSLLNATVACPTIFICLAFEVIVKITEDTYSSPYSIPISVVDRI